MQTFKKSALSLLAVGFAGLALAAVDAERLEALKAAGVVDEYTMVYLPLDSVPAWNKEIDNYAYGEYKLKAISCPYGEGESISPVISNETPGDKVLFATRKSSTELENENCFHFISRDPAKPQRSGAISIDDTQTDLVIANSFTFEMFIRWDKKPSVGTHYFYGTHQPNGNFLGYMGKDGKCATSFWIGAHDDVESKSYTHAWPGFNYADGKWHHYAVAYDKEEQSVTVYVDYALIGKTEGVVLDASARHGSYNKTFMIGTAYYPTAEAYQMPDGRIDEVRLTRRVLTPKDFLFPYRMLETDTLLHLSFEGGSLGLWPYPITRGPASRAYEAVSDDTIGGLGVKANHVPLTDSNTNSLAVAQNGSVTWKDDWLFAESDYDALTIEFFCKGSKIGKWSPFFDLQGVYKDATDKTYTIAAVQGANNGTNFRSAFHATSYTSSLWAMTIGTKEDPTLPQVAIDGEWHHVGVVFKSENGRTKATGYYDYKQIATDNGAGGRLFKGTELIANAIKLGSAMNGNVDEIRVTKKALAPSQFLRRITDNGMVILLK